MFAQQEVHIETTATLDAAMLDDTSASMAVKSFPGGFEEEGRNATTPNSADHASNVVLLPSAGNIRYWTERMVPGLTNVSRHWFLNSNRCMQQSVYCQPGLI